MIWQRLPDKQGWWLVHVTSTITDPDNPEGYWTCYVEDNGMVRDLICDMYQVYDSVQEYYTTILSWQWEVVKFQFIAEAIKG